MQDHSQMTIEEKRLIIIGHLTKEDN
jgi:hypothetical protein